jgi:hypothetical protein
LPKGNGAVGVGFERDWGLRNGIERSASVWICHATSAWPPAGLGSDDVWLVGCHEPAGGMTERRRAFTAELGGVAAAGAQPRRVRPIRHPPGAYETRSICIRRVSWVAKICRRNSSLFFLTSDFVHCAIQIRAGFTDGTFSLGNIALTSYKQAIFYASAYQKTRLCNAELGLRTEH